jgi:hypothetical protein
MHTKPPIDAVWAKISALAGAEFATITGLPFTFTVTGDVLRTSRTKYSLGKSDFAKALALAPLDGPGEINALVRGPAYIWAILHDQRVRGKDW